MLHPETFLASGHVFQTEVQTAQIGAHDMALAIATSHDPVLEVSTSQSVVSLDGRPVLTKTMRVEGRSCDAVLEFGPGLGDGRLTLHWALMPEKAALIAHGYGEWNDRPLTAFAHRLEPGADGRMHLVNQRAFRILKLDCGGAVPERAEPEVAAALADFGARVSACRHAPTGCVAGCASRSGTCALACRDSEVDPTASITPAHATACAVLESTCLAETAAPADRDWWHAPEPQPMRAGAGLDGRAVS